MIRAVGLSAILARSTLGLIRRIAPAGTASASCVVQ